MPKLDQRLIAVTRRVRSTLHADIGSDHGLLLASMLGSGRIQYGIAIENKQQPWENSRRTLESFAADVRLGDGLECLERGEADSLSICGMGAENMIGILERFPDRIPAAIVLQPNSRAELVRKWAWHTGFHLMEEEIIRTTGKYAVFSFQRSPAGTVENDPAYEGIELECGFAFGPRLLKQHQTELIADLVEEEKWWCQFEQLKPAPQRRLKLVQVALADLKKEVR